MGNQENKLYHFVGIKGSGMSSLALVLHQKGYNVQGSDVEEYFFTQRDLEKSGVPILPFNADNIDKDMIVIAGNAFPDTHEEIARAIELGAEVIRYHDFIARFIEPYTSIAVTGSHGKTSTTGLLAHVLSGINPTSYLIGDGTGHGEPDADFFAFEACEYRRHFLAYSPDYAIMTNIDFDHPDYYKSIEDVFSAFQTMAHQVKKGIFAYGDDKYLRQLESEVPVYYYGVSEEDDIQARNIQRTTEGSSFDVYHKDDFVGHFVLPAFGHHNIMNALGVIAVAYFEKLDMQKVAEEMLSFKGVKRRFSEKKVSDMIIVDDYAHHPTEIAATIKAAKALDFNRVHVLFQPHRYSRIGLFTHVLRDEFSKAFNDADAVTFMDVYSAGETPVPGVTGATFMEPVREGYPNRGSLTYIPRRLEVVPTLTEELQPGDLLITMGAGDVTTIGAELVAALIEKYEA